MDKPFYADGLGFFGFSSDPLVVPDGLKLDLVHMTAAPPWLKTMKETIAAHRAFRAQLEAHPQLQVVTTKDELESAIADEKTAVILGLQNLPDDTTKEDIHGLKKDGVSIVALAYQDENEFGSGWMNAGIDLKSEGLKILKACTEANMVVDLSHAGHHTARGILATLDILAASGKYEHNPAFHVLASHGGCYSVYPHMRNLPDDVLKGVAQMSGVVGIYTLTFGLDALDNSLEPFVRHLRRAIEICGENAIVLGTDGIYVELESQKEVVENFKELMARLGPSNIYNARCPDQPWYLYTPVRMELLESYLTFTNRTIPAHLVKKVMGDNLLAFFRRALPD